VKPDPEITFGSTPIFLFRLVLYKFHFFPPNVTWIVSR